MQINPTVIKKISSIQWVSRNLSGNLEEDFSNTTIPQNVLNIDSTHIINWTRVQNDVKNVCPVSGNADN